MQFVDHSFGPRPAGVRKAITQCTDIDDLARFPYILGLKARGWVWYNQILIDAKLVARTYMRIGAEGLIPPVGVFGHAFWSFARFEQFKRLSAWCPQIKNYAVVCYDGTMAARMACCSNVFGQRVLVHFFLRAVFFFLPFFLPAARMLSTRLG
jgi:hypothetical protein